MNQEKTILVVDDDPLICKAFTRTLEKSGNYIVHSFTDPIRALSVLSGVTIDLCITDIQMPGLSGTELALKLRSTQPGLPLVFISGMDDALEKIEHLFPDDDRIVCLKKPVKPERLIRLTENLLNC